jgi:hypothetical protein
VCFKGLFPNPLPLGTSHSHIRNFWHGVGHYVLNISPKNNTIWVVLNNMDRCEHARPTKLQQHMLSTSFPWWWKKFATHSLWMYGDNEKPPKGVYGKVNPFWVKNNGSYSKAQFCWPSLDSIEDQSHPPKVLICCQFIKLDESIITTIYLEEELGLYYNHIIWKE